MAQLVTVCLTSTGLGIWVQYSCKLGAVAFGNNPITGKMDRKIPGAFCLTSLDHWWVTGSVRGFLQNQSRQHQRRRIDTDMWPSHTCADILTCSWTYTLTNTWMHALIINSLKSYNEYFINLLLGQSIHDTLIFLFLGLSAGDMLLGEFFLLSYWLPLWFINSTLQLV